jgi:hypothetical protein
MILLNFMTRTLSQHLKCFAVSQIIWVRTTFYERFIITQLKDFRSQCFSWWLTVAAVASFGTSGQIVRFFQQAFSQFQT